KNALSVVADLVGLAVHQAFGPHNDAARCLANRLMPEAYSEDWNFSREPLNALDRDARLARRAGPWRNDQMRRGLGRDFVAGDLVVAMDLDRQPGINLAQPLDEVVGERVVIVD